MSNVKLNEITYDKMLNQKHLGVWIEYISNINGLNNIIVSKDLIFLFLVNYCAFPVRIPATMQL